MKRNLIIVMFLFGLTAFVKAQWTVYDGSVLPDAATPAWSTGDVGTPPATYGIIDGFVTGNKVLYETTASESDKMSYKLNGTRPVNGTWVIQTKAGKNPASMEFEFHGATGTTPDTAFRINIKLYPDLKGGYIKLNYVSDGDAMYPADSSLDVRKWHTYRITVENARQFKIYVDEDPSPVITCTGSTSTNSQILRIGDIGSAMTEGYIDWMAWDFGGAYAPGAGTALPGDLITGTVKGNIVFITGTVDDRDSSNIKFLQSEGYVVSDMAIPKIVLVGQDTIDKLNSADLIIVGWDFASSWFNATNGRDIWNNKITVPLLDIYPNVARANTCNWFKSSSTKHLTPPSYPDTIWSVIMKPGDPVFDGVTLPDDTIDWSLSPITYMQETTESGGEVLVKDASINALHFVRWDAGQKFYPGSDASAWAAGPRTYFGFGNNSYKIGGETQYSYWTLTENSKMVYLAEIDRLINTYYEPYLGSDDASLANLITSSGSLDPAFNPTTYEYDLEIKSPVVELTGIANEGVATVVGDGIIDLTGVSDSTITISVISSSTTDTLDYLVNITVAQPKIIFVTDDNLDDPNVEFLKRQGFDVTKVWYPNMLGAAGQDTIDMLNAANLVIIGRSGGSTNFQQPADKDAWNHLTSPQLLICPWKARNSRLNWFNSGTANQINVSTGTTEGFAVDPADEVFADVNLVGDSLTWSFLADDYILVKQPSNGDWIVNRGDSIPLVVRFDVNVPFYPGATDSAWGPRSYIGMGNDANGPANFFPLTREAKKIYLAEICRLMNVPVPEIVYAAPDFSVTMVTDDNFDQPCITFLQKNGFKVKTFWPPKMLGAAGQDTIDMLNAEDLVIIGRSGGSTNFQQQADKDAWNQLTSPLILNCPWKARNSRLNWFNSGTANQINVSEGTTTAVAVDHNDPVFDFAPGVAPNGNIPEWSFLADDYILVKQPSNGDYIVDRGDSIPLVVRFDVNVPFYPGATDSAYGPRTYFGMGNDANGPSNFFPLTKTGQAIYFAEALRLVGAPAYEPIYLGEDRSLASLTVSVGTLLPAFNADSLTYTVALPEGTQPTDSVQVTATATEATSVVTGTGWVKVPNLSNNATVTCTAENARPLLYRITFTRPTGVEEYATTNSSCNIYPNPVNDKLVISATDAINSITIYNLQGTAVFSRKVNGRTVELSLSELNAGIYFVKVQSGSEVYVSKITKN
jgi:hypothetical protein